MKSKLLSVRRQGNSVSRPDRIGKWWLWGGGEWFVVSVVSLAQAARMREGIYVYIQEPPRPKENQNG